MWQAPRPLASAIVLALGITGVLAPPSLGKTQKKPDLIVTQARKFGPAYAFQGSNVTLSFRDGTKNRKQTGHDAAAGPSRTAMILVPAHSSDPNPTPLRVAARAVPGLRPDHSHSGAASGAVATSILPLGSYKLLVCADFPPRIKERNEHNNCKRTGNFYVIKESWYGSVNGVGACCGAARAEKWHTLGAHLDFGEYIGGGIFRYDFNGTVEWNDSGVNMGGCTIDGHGEKAFDHVPGPKLDYFAGTYQGEVPVGGAFYDITLSGGGGFPCSSTVPGPVTQQILNIKDPKPLVFDQNALTGQFSTPGAEGTTWTWDFR